MCSKSDEVCRILFLNPHGLGPANDGNKKMDNVRTFLKKHKIDILGLSETNVDWRKVPVKDTMWGRFQGCFEHKYKLSVAHNIRRKTKGKKRYQAGGTSILAMNGMAQGQVECGKDTRGLGRWSWMRFLGKDGVSTRVISVYCPTRNKTEKSGGTYGQHREYFLSLNMDVCPIKQFWEDLKIELQHWQDEGDQIVLGGDWNTPIAKVNTYLCAFNLKEAITTKHGLDSAPNTCISGSKPIDGIYTSHTFNGSCGYLPFYKGGLSPDHRPIWIELQVDAMLGYSVSTLSSPNIRRLKTKDPRVVKRYQNLLHEFCLKHNIYQKTRQLMKKVTYPLSAKLQEEFAKLDNQRCNGMRMAEKRCRKLHTGQYAWSPEFDYSRKLVSFWSLMKKRSEKEYVHAQRLVRLLEKLDFTVDTFDKTLEECKTNLDKAWERYKDAKENAEPNRVKYLEELAKALADSDDEVKISKRLKMLLHCEEQRRVAKVIKYTTKRLFDSGTTKVLLVNKDGKTIREVVSKEELEEVIIAENERKYHRTEAYCPLLLGQLRNDIGLCGDGPMVDSILAGTYTCPPGTPSGTVKFIQAMKSPTLTQQVRDRAAFTSVEEFSRCWARAKEGSSSCGDLHYGHYKAGCKHESLRELHYLMAQISLESGCYLAKHRTGVDVMLLKKAGDYRLERLRTICLFDAEFNMNNGRVGKAALDATIAAGEFSDEQYSRPCRGSLDHVVNRVLSFNYFIYHRRPFGLCSCDLAGNYDRIVHSAASLALQRVGVPQARVKGMFDTIQRLVKRVRTAYGESDETYGGDDVPFPYIAPPQGVYQGNRNGPPVWSVISSTVFSILRAEGFGVKFVSALSEELFHLCGFAFVDDTDLIQSGDTSFTVGDDLQRAMVLWEGVMHATGQAMAPSKSWWYLLDFVWKKGEWTITDGGVRTDLVAHDSDGSAVSLTRLMFSKATKMLGVYLAPDGNMDAELAYLRSKAMEWSDYIRCGHLSKGETWVALSTYIWKTITYPLAATTFQEKQLSHITWPILQVALPRMGLCRHIATELRYGPRNLGGLGLVDPFLEQGIRKIEYVVEHGWRRTPTGFLIKSCIDSLSLECGVFGELLTQSSDPLQWCSVETSWIQSVWKFICEKHIQISGVQDNILSPQRDHDVELMTSFRDAGISTTDLRRLNRCRLFLQVISLSDVCNASGTCLHSACFPAKGRKPSGGVIRNRYQWPVQHCPSQSDWTLWRDALISTFCTTDDGLLRSPLGTWKCSDLHLWDWYGSHDEFHKVHMLWRFTKRGWLKYRKVSTTSRRTQRFHCLGLATAPPTRVQLRSMCRVTVERFHDHYCLRSTSKESLLLLPADLRLGATPTLPSSFATFTSFMSECVDGKWLYSNFSFKGDILDLLRDLWLGKLVCISDGSYSVTLRLGTASFKLESADGTSWIRCECLVPGPPEVQSAYRSELAGILGVAGLLWGLWSVSKSTPRWEAPDVWDIIVGCDGKSALTTSLRTQPERLSCRHKHFDLISMIIGYWREVPFHSFPIHVKGHQDTYLQRHQLSRLELMNIEVDRCAKQFLTRCARLGVPPVLTYPSPFGMPVVTYQGDVVCTTLYHSLHSCCTRDALISYWSSRWSFTVSQHNRFAWETFSKAMGGLKWHKSTFVMKWLSRQTSLGSRKRSRDMTAPCPRCKHLVDDESHCLRCPKARSKLLTLFESLLSDLEERQTHPCLIKGLRICTDLWLHPGRPQRPGYLLRELPQCIRQVLCEHYSFGWLNFLQGLHFRSLTEVQLSYFQFIGSTKSATKWHSLLIRGLWDIVEQIYFDRVNVLTLLEDGDKEDHPALPFALRVAKAELKRGQRSISGLYHQYFSHTPSSLEDMDGSTLRDWLRIVIVNREKTNDSIELEKCFSPGGLYRSWLMKT